MQSSAKKCCQIPLDFIYRFRITMKDKSINEEDKVFHTYVYTYDNNPKQFFPRIEKKDLPSKLTNKPLLSSFNNMMS